MDKYIFTDDGEVAHVLKNGGSMTAEEIVQELRDGQAATELARGGEKSGVWQFFQDGEWHVGMNQLNHRENTEALGCPVRDLYTHPPAPVVPECYALVPKMPEISHYSEWGKGYKEGWNNCREAILKICPEPPNE